MLVRLGAARPHVRMGPGAPDSPSRSRRHCPQPRPTFYSAGMYRNIRPLHNFEPPASVDEVRTAALQYVRKISGTTSPSQRNAEAFD
ncbi:MAG TPA: DUF2277 domain-containing protein, partial [Nocardioidaceae bacterium]|nr:DUF2277 domain-containing protein [Nocardioidaceae bacterium]